MRVWICQIAKNTYYSYLKKNRRMVSVDIIDAMYHLTPAALEKGAKYEVR